MKWKAAVTVVALIALGALMGTLVPALSQQGGRTETITVREPDGKAVEFDIDVTGDGDTEDEGDINVGSGPLFRGGEKVGSERHECVFVKTTRKIFALHCDGTFTIKGRGKLEIQGMLSFTRRAPQSTTLSIVGGTGEFRDAGGVMVFKGKENATVFEFHIVHQ